MPAQFIISTAIYQRQHKFLEYGFGRGSFIQLADVIVEQTVTVFMLMLYTWSEAKPTKSKRKMQETN